MISRKLVTRPACNSGAVVQGKHYRITVLTPSLLRLEYSCTGYFEDRATQSVVNRNFATPRFEANRESVNGVEFLTLETDDLLLRYDQDIFSEEGLQIQVKGIEGAVWHFGQELHDLQGTYRTLDRVDGDTRLHYDGTTEKISLGHGIISREGFSVIDDSRSMALTEDGWIEPRTPCIDLYFFGYGHRYLEALNDFYHLCGQTPLLPRYALGNWWSRYHKYSEEEYKKLILRFESEKLPFTVAVVDIDWHLVDDVDPKYGNGWTGYTWNRKLFPDPGKFMQWLHSKNLKVTLNVHPADGVRAYEEIYPKMAQAMGIDPATEEPVNFDPADPFFMEKYFNILCHDLEKQGVDFWWIDWQQGEESKIPGLDPLWILNHFHYLDSAWKGTRPLTFSRYAGIGSHRYPIGFSGDTAITWASLAYQPYFTSTASNVGYGWWSHDIGGHMLGSRNDELLARWVQYGVFSPINRLHSSNNPFVGKEPWNYDAATEDVMKRYLRLRHSLIPYLYTMNRRASRDNLPLIQPMYYAEPECEEAYSVPNEYYFGTELLISPITEPVDHVSRNAKAATWLPKGKWADMFTGMVYEGGRMIDLWRPLTNIPVLMKAGAIVPMKNMDIYDNTCSNPAAMEVLVFPAACGNFTMWEDNGDLPVDNDENWASTELQWSSNTFKIHAAQGNTAVIPKERSWKLVFGATENIIDNAACTCVSVMTDNGKHLTAEVSYAEERSSLIVSIPAVSIEDDVIVSFENPLKIVDNSVQQCYAILHRAQMNYDQKNKIWRTINAGGNIKEALDEIDMDASVRASLYEIIG